MAEAITEMIIPGTYIEVRSEGLIGVSGIASRRCTFGQGQAPESSSAIKLAACTGSASARITRKPSRPQSQASAHAVVVRPVPPL